MFTLANYLGGEATHYAAELTLYAQHKLNAGRLTCGEHVQEEAQFCKMVGINLLDEVTIGEMYSEVAQHGVCIVEELDTLRTFYYKDGQLVLVKQGYLKQGGGEYEVIGNTVAKELWNGKC